MVDCGRKLRSEDPTAPKSGSANPESGELGTWGRNSKEQTRLIPVKKPVVRGGLTGGVLKVKGK